MKSPQLWHKTPTTVEILNEDIGVPEIPVFPALVRKVISKRMAKGHDNNGRR